MDSCIFCKVASGQIPARVVKQNEKAVAFLDAFPLAAGHVLVIPKSHYARVQDMSGQDALAVFSLVREVAGKVESATGATASTIAIHNGKDAGQEVMHVHVHIIPRKPGDGAGPVHSMFHNRPQLSAPEMDALASKMAA